MGMKVIIVLLFLITGCGSSKLQDYYRRIWENGAKCGVNTGSVEICLEIWDSDK